MTGSAVPLPSPVVTRPDAIASITRSAIARVVAGDAPSGLVIHTHGGLVNDHDQAAIVARLEPIYTAAGACPVFLNWRSSAFQVVMRWLKEVAHDSVGRVLLKHVVAHVSAKIAGHLDGGEDCFPVVDDGTVAAEFERLSRGDEPFVEWSDAGLQGLVATDADARHLADSLRTDPELRRTSSDLAASLIESGASCFPPASPQARLLAPSVVAEVRRDVDREGTRAGVIPERVVRGAIAVLQRTCGRLASGRGHGLYPTVLEEVLREFYLADWLRFWWRNLIAEASSVNDPEGPGDGATVLQTIAAACPAGVPLRVTLVGHSAGWCVNADWLIRARRLPQNVVFDAVALGPACSFSESAAFFTAVRRRLRGFRLFGLGDAAERRDAFVPFVYPRSALYFLSGVLADEADTPILGMERFFGPDHGSVPNQADYDAVAAALTCRSHALVWSPAAWGPGATSSAAHHQSLDEDPAILQSLHEIVRYGLPVPRGA